MKKLFGAFIISFVLASFIGGGVFAYTDGALNDSMQAAVDWAKSDLRNFGVCRGPYGAIWATTLGTKNKYEAKVYVTAEAEKVTINVIGNVYSCGNDKTPAYAVNIKSGTSWYSIPRGVSLNRGYASDVSGTWSTPGPGFNATIDLIKAGIPKNEDDKAKEYTIYANMYRCFSSNGVTPTGSCKWELFPIVVVRNPGKKISYQTRARSYVKSDGSNADTNWGKASRRIEVSVGDEIYFKHTLENVGDNSSEKISNVVVRANDNYSQSRKLGAGEASLQVYSGTISRGAGLFAQASPVGSKQMNGSYLTYVVQASDVGKTLCSRIEFTESGKNRAGISDQFQKVNTANVGYTEYACAYVSYDYEVTTDIPLDGKCSKGDSCDREEEAGAPDIPIPAFVNMPESNTKIRETNWKLTYFVVRPDSNIPGKNSITDNWGGTRSGGFFDYNTISDPCSANHYSQPGSVFQVSETDHSKKIKGCEVVRSGKFDSASGRTEIQTEVYGEIGKFSVPEMAEIGTKYCFALSVSPYIMRKDWSEDLQKNFNGWHHGKPACIIVVKKPKAQILGAGLFSGEGVFGLNSTRKVADINRTFGSWVEYEIVSNGVNSKVASNGVFGYPNGATGFAGGTASDKVQNRLTFANKSSFGNSGVSYSSKAFIEKMKAIYSGKKETSKANSIALSGSNEDLLFKSTSKVSLSGGSIGSGNVVIFAPNQEVEISGNIQQSGVRSSLNLGQVIIIAKNVKIKQDVTRLDAWILTEKIDTCSDVASSTIRSGVCANPLDINGVVAISGSGESILLKRTAGSEGASDGIGYPAETFRLTPDAYQWIFNQSQKNGVKITTTYSKELPVRY